LEVHALRRSLLVVALVVGGSMVVLAQAREGPAAMLLGFGGMALYTRIRPTAALENGTRKVIFEAVCRAPGLGVHAVAKAAGVSYSTTAYHLERLVEAGMIVMTPDGNKLCYYKNGGAFTETERRLLPVLKNDEAARLLEAILESPGTYRAALAERLGVTATTVNWHLKRLREAGLVEEVRTGRNAYLYPRVGSLRESLSALAVKVEPNDLAVAERLRRYAAHAS
jgi:DNA-binding transcriptional ArsR family regulator